VSIDEVEDERSPECDLLAPFGGGGRRTEELVNPQATLRVEVVCCIVTDRAQPPDISVRPYGSLTTHGKQVALSMFGRQAFSVAGPAAWNSLPDYLRDPSRSFDSFRHSLKTFF